MAMGYGANCAIVIEEDSLKKIVPNEYQAFLDACKKAQITVDDVAFQVEFYDDIAPEVPEQDYKNVESAFKKLTQAFRDQTGIRLNIGYHSVEDHGDIYDEVDGGYFYLHWADVYIYTPEAQMLYHQADFDLKFWVSFG